MSYRKENGLPRQCAHWFAMTCRRQKRVCGCKDVVRNDMQKEGRVRGCKDAVRNDMQKTEACQRLQGVVRNAMQKTGTRNRQFPNLLE